LPPHAAWPLSLPVILTAIIAFSSLTRASATALPSRLPERGVLRFLIACNAAPWSVLAFTQQFPEARLKNVTL